MARGPDLSGRRFGRLRVILRAPTRQVGRWLCLCGCGRSCIVATSALNRGYTRSCGCLQRDYARTTPNVKPIRTHGMSKLPEYGVWHAMKERCQKADHPAYPRYGGRGIVFDPRWESFEQFYADMGPRPSGLHSLDRVDNEGPYTAANCRWATPHEQQSNTRAVVLLTYHGETLTISEWSRRTGLRRGAIAYRVAHGWDVERIFTTPSQGRPRSL